MITQLHVQIDSTEKTDIYLFAHADGAAGPVGLLVLGIEDGENSGWISRLFIEPAYRQRGLAKELLAWALLICKDKGRAFASLSVKNDNETAQQLYKSLGFVPFMTGQEGYVQYLKTL